MQRQVSFSFFTTLLVLAALTTTADADPSTMGASLSDSTTTSQTRRRTIVGGDVADPTKYPYYVQLDDPIGFFCGGSLIHPEFVLTAAHCAHDPTPLLAIIGGYNHEIGTGVTRVVREVFIHPAYEGVLTMSNDMALLRIHPPYLPSDGAVLLNYTRTRDWLHTGESVMAIGLGNTSPYDVDDAFPDELQQVELKFLDDETCDDKWDGGIHRKSMLCASDPGQDTCQGDSGGPLIKLGDDPSQDVQVGVVSWGGECGDDATPGVYTDVAYFAPWIESIICQHATDQKVECKVLVDSVIEPIVIDPTIETCRDFAGAFYTDWWHQFQRCDWLREKGRINWYCTENQEAWLTCPLTCHGCTYETDDDDITWTYDSSLEESSSSPALAFCFIFVTVAFVCLICFQCGVCRRYRDKCRRKKSTEEATTATAREEEEVVVPAHQERAPEDA